MRSKGIRHSHVWWSPSRAPSSGEAALRAREQQRREQAVERMQQHHKLRREASERLRALRGDAD
jgi:hypothetical protein